MAFTLDFVTKTEGWAKEFRRNKPHWDRFHSCGSDVERFRMAREFLAKRVAVDIRPDEGGESEDSGTSFLKDGDGSCARGSFDKALAAYNLAICHLPWSDTCGRGKKPEKPSSLALCFERRSAVLFKLKRYGDCVRDIEDALILGYPPAKSKKLFVRKASALVAAGRPDAAVRCLGSEVVELGVCEEGYFERETSDPDVSEMKRLLAQARGGAEKMAASGTQRKPLERTNPDGYEMRAKLGKIALTKGKHPIFPAASTLVKLEYNPKVGRHFVAAADLSGGEILLIERAFVAALKGPDSLSQHCCACLVWTDTPFPCKTCREAVFCSSACAVTDKGLLHAKECPFLLSMTMLHELPLTPVDNFPTLVLRTLLSKSLDGWREFSKRSPGNIPGEADDWKGTPKDTYLPDDYDNVFCLTKKVGKREPADVVIDAFKAVVVVSAFLNYHGGSADAELRDFLGGVALRHFLNFKLNAIEIFDFVVEERERGGASPRCKTSGLAVCPTLALFNFSCDANTVVTFYADVAVLTAARPVAAGEAVTLWLEESDYLPSPRDERRHFLRTEYLFECKCRACEEDWPTYLACYEKQNASGRFVVRCLGCRRRLCLFKDLYTLAVGGGGCSECGAPAARVLDQLFEGDPSGLTTEQLFAVVGTAHAAFEMPSIPLMQHNLNVRRRVWSQGNRRVGSKPPMISLTPENCATM